MKVLVATNMYPTNRRPYLGIFVHEQVESLRAAGLSVDVATHVAEDSRKAYWTGLWDLRRRLRSGHYDLIHTHHTYSTILAWLARLMSGRRHVPIVMTFHESEVFQRGADYGQDVLRRLKYLKWLKAFALKRADYVIPVQRDMTRIVMGDRRAARLRQTVIPAGIDLERFSPDAMIEARRRMGWSENGLCVLYPCDPAKPEKRADLARGGFDRWRSKLPEEARKHAWLVIGGGIEYSHMPDAIRSANAVLVPTDYEASPTIVKEALACERPVVTTDVGDVREVYEDLPGLLICEWNVASVASALKRAIELGGAYGGRQRLITRELGLNQVAERIRKVYMEVLKKRQS